MFSAILMVEAVASAATASLQDKPPIPPDLLFISVPVPAEENAIIDWRRASQLKVILDARLYEVARYAWQPGEKEPGPDKRNEIQAWLRSNREALNLMEASLQKTKAQWPERNFQKDQPELTGLSVLTRARLLEADELAENHDFKGASESLIGSLHIAQRGIEADAGLIDYLLASNVRTMVQGGMVRFAGRTDVPVPILEQLLKELPNLDSETNTYAHILRVEFSMYDYPSMIDIKKLADQWSKISETNFAMILFPYEFQRPFKVLIDPLLVSQHPMPFDVVAELETSARWYRIYGANAVGPWSERSTQVEDERKEKGEELLKDIGPLMKIVEDEPLPLSRAAAQSARDAYLNIQNPIGRIIHCEIGNVSGSDARVFRNRTEREATRAILAALIFERRKGRLPASLTQLVEEKVLDRVPQDPFAGKPLSYSRARRIVWSVAEDGKDDNGKGNAKNRWAGDDAIWMIPEIK